ncbi:B12-binding domain-containing radical SAM protein [bacterium]|nr:B12-binding domain-containing radical SAM protein [bacterium]MBU1024692.1 B12-binding domain-containing radical SAM protein [bacterium]
MLTPYVPDGQRAVERIFGCNYGLYPMPNIFVLYAAGKLESVGFDVKIVDVPVLGLDEKGYRDYLTKDNSFAYVVYSTLLAKEMDIKAHGHLRKVKPDVPVIYIGPAPTDDPEYFLVDSNSYVLRGEPEQSLANLSQELARSDEKSTSEKGFDIPGLSYRFSGKIINIPSSGVIENLDALPHPARHLVNSSKYFSPKFGVSPVTVMLTSRGCTAQCIYCVPCSLSFAREIEYKKDHGRKPPVRMRSVENVIEEIELIANDGYRAVSIIDDQFIWGEQRTVAISQAFKKHHLAWGCLARADMITEPIAKALSISGCRFVDLGVESFNPEILEYVQKGVTVRQTEDAIKLLRKYKVFVKANILIGSSPLETKETIRETIRKAVELDVNSIMVGATNPFPGTEFYELAKENGWFVRGDYYASDSQREWVMEYPHFSREDMDEMLRWANRQFFFRPRFFLRQVHRLKNPVDFFKTVGTFVRKLGWIWH